jgi:hypothetical protein
VVSKEIISKSYSYIVYRDFVRILLLIRDEQDSFLVTSFRSDFKKSSVRPAPDCIKSTFKKNIWPFSKLPSLKGWAIIFKSVEFSFLKPFIG